MKKLPIIQVAGLKKSFPRIPGYKDLFFHPFRREKVKALRGVSFEVNRSTCFCLLGPNGAGKTTLIKILATLVLPDEGKAQIAGFDVIKDHKEVKKIIGYAVSEERSFYWRLTGRQNLEFFGILYGIPRSKINERINSILKLTGLQHVADLRFNTYSTGMRQMMSIARALISETEILFVDEPTRSLDPKAAEKMRMFLKKELVEKQGKTLFWASHNLNEVLDYADELAVICNGKIRKKGNLEVLTEKGRKSLLEVYEETIDMENLERQTEGETV